MHSMLWENQEYYWQHYKWHQHIGYFRWWQASSLDIQHMCMGHLGHRFVCSCIWVSLSHILSAMHLVSTQLGMWYKRDTLEHLQQFH